MANKKLGLKFIGPYRVIKKLSEVTYEIQAHITGKKKVVHVNHLKPYLSENLPDDTGQLPDIPDNLDLDGLPSDYDSDTDCDDQVGSSADLADTLDLTNIFDEAPHINDSSPTVGCRSRQPPQRFGHNVGFL